MPDGRIGSLCPGNLFLRRPYVERFGGTSLLEHGIEPESVFPVPSQLPRLTHTATKITPALIVNSVFSEYATGRTRRLPYESPQEAFEIASRHIREASRPSYTWLYLSALDGLAHSHGADSDPVARELELYESLLDELAADLEGKARIAVTADHGHVNVPDDARHRLDEDDPLVRLLKAPFCGEPTVPIFHVREGQADRFASAFRRRFGEHFALLATHEVEQLELLGPGRLSTTTRARLGDFIAVAPKPSILMYADESGVAPSFRGFHAGLTPREMNVPLFLA